MSDYVPTPAFVEREYVTGRLRRSDVTAPEARAEFARMIAEVERAAAVRARGEALIEVVQAHRDLHKTYGSTVACRGGIGGQALTSHCAEICYNADAHEKEIEAWQKLEIEAIEYSRARAAEIREGKNND